MTFGHGLFAAVGSAQIQPQDPAGRAIITSPDGVNWSEHRDVPYASPDLRALNALSPVGDLQSAHHRKRPMPPPNSAGFLYEVLFANNRFVAVGGFTPAGPQPTSQTILTSNDGLSWSGSRTLYPPPLRGIAFGNGIFAGAADRGRVYISTANGWETGFDDASRVYNDVIFDSGTFLIVGANGLIATSSSATHWVAHNTSSTRGLHGAAYGHGTIVVVGEAGTILQSDPLTAGPDRPLLSNLVRHGSKFSVSITTTPGRRYILEFASNLPARSWTALASVNGDGSTQTLIDNSADQSQRFYRVRIEYAL